MLRHEALTSQTQQAFLSISVPGTAVLINLAEKPPIEQLFEWLP